MIMTQEQRDTMRRRQEEGGYIEQPFIVDPPEPIYKDADGLTVYEHQEPTNIIELNKLAEKIFYLHNPTKQDIERCLKPYLGDI